MSFTCELFTSIFRSFVGPFAGALAGATAAFFYDKGREKNTIKQQALSSLKQSEYIIELICKNVDQFDLSRNKEKNDDKGYEFETKRRLNIDILNININVSSLLFLMDIGSQGKKTLDSILLVDNQYKMLLDGSKKFNDLYTIYLDKILPNRDKLQKKDLKGIMGERSFYEIIELDKIINEQIRQILHHCEIATFNINLEATRKELQKWK